MNEEADARHEAILLLGPTGSGKTPLGDLIERRGLWGRPCRHFDFGRELRRIAAGHGPAGLLTAEEMAFIARVLEAGALLENEHFHIAWKILTAFLAENATAAAGAAAPLIALNGLPRHLGQAGDVDCIVDIRTVVHLRCTPEVVLERIRTNAGGDRAGRPDDDLDAVRRKLALFEDRTSPLIDHYRVSGARIIEFPVVAGATAEGLYKWLQTPPEATEKTRCST